MRIMVSQMNSVQEPSLIEKTQAWSAMKEMVLVSQFNCVNVLSRAGGEGGEREENTKRAWDRGETADRQIKLSNESVENQMD